MSKIRNIGSNSSFVSIRYASLKEVLPNANEHEKIQPTFLDIAALHVSVGLSNRLEPDSQPAEHCDNDLLSTALDQLEGSLEATHPWGESEKGLEYLPTQKTDYQALVKKHLEESK